MPNLGSTTIVKMIGRRANSLTAEEPIPGMLLLLPIKDRAPDIEMSSPITKLIPWGELDRYRLLAVRDEDGLEILLTYD